MVLNQENRYIYKGHHLVSLVGRCATNYLYWHPNRTTLLNGFNSVSIAPRDRQVYVYLRRVGYYCTPRPPGLRTWGGRLPVYNCKYLNCPPNWITVQPITWIILPTGPLCIPSSQRINPQFLPKFEDKVLS